MSFMTRRRFLLFAGAAGGSTAVLHASYALGLMVRPAERARDPIIPRLDPAAPRPHVLILGAGIGGLSAAWELQKAGYDYTILEASHRVGGRNFTLRRGTVIDELGNRQVCNFDDDPDLYFNAGPARIPGLHHRFLAYCREFGVALEPFVNRNYNAWVQGDELNGGKRLRQREFIADARGLIAELASKGVSDAALDRPMSADDIESVRAYLQAFGGLDGKLRYRGTDRAGYARGGMLYQASLKPPRDLGELLRTDYAFLWMNFTETPYQAPSMVQPVGGMDRIVDAFVGRLRKAPVLRARVTGIHHRDNGVEVSYEQDGRERRIVGDYCLSAIPGHLMPGIDNNLSPAYRRDIHRIRRGMLSKVGLQMKRRFWEDEGIYGGISWTDHPVQQMWYPSHGANTAKGIMLGAYIFYPWDNEAFARRSHAGRLAWTMEAGEKLHPGNFARNVETGNSVAWHRMNHLLGCGHGLVSERDPHNAEDDATRLRLLAGDRRYFTIGDQVSLHPGWQEGALAVTEKVLADLAMQQAGRILAGQQQAPAP